MSSPARLQELLARYQQLRSQGHAVDLDKLCTDTPDLLQDLQARVQTLESRHTASPSEATQSFAPRLEAASDSATQPTQPEGADDAEPWPKVPGYEILGRLGGGGMGVVYKARQSGLNRVVALKMIKAGSRASAREIARFRIEAEAVARLRHPHIVQIHAIGDYDGLPFFSLEYCEGGSLAKKLNGTPLSPPAAAQLVETLARAMHAAHEHGILHRDLKPANILLTADGAASAAGLNEPKIADFGLAKKLDDDDSGQTRAGLPMGTPSYMAPEQAQGDTAAFGPATDVYALGAILYELLTGRPPFKAASVWDTVHQVLHDETVPPRRLQPRTPRDLDVICWKCLAKDRRRRYVSAAELADDLRRFLAGEPIRARPVSSFERAAKWVRRRPAAAALAAIIAASIAGVILGSWWHIQQLGASNENLRASIEREQQFAELAKNNETRAFDNATAAAAQSEAAKRRLGYAMDAVNKMLTRTSTDKTLLLNMPHMEKVRAQLLEDALAFYQQFLKEESREAKVRMETAKALDRVASIQHALHRFKESAAHYEAAVRIFTDLADERTDADYVLAVARCRNGLAIVLDELGRRDDARRQHELSAALLRAAPLRDHADAQNSLAICLLNLARIHHLRKTPHEAEQCFVEALAIQAKLLALDRTEPDYLNSAARTHLNFAILLESQARTTEAGDQYAAAVKLGQALVQREPATADYRSLFAHVRNCYAVFLHRGGDLDGAESEHAGAVAQRQQLVDDFPAFPQFQQDLAGTCNNLAILYDRRGKRAEAETHFKTALTMREKLVAGQPESLDHWQKLVRSRSNWAMFFERSDRPADRLIALHALANVRDRLPQQFRSDFYIVDHLAKAHDALAEHFKEVGQAEVARQHTRQASWLRRQLETAK